MMLQTFLQMQVKTSMSRFLALNIAALLLAFQSGHHLQTPAQHVLLQMSPRIPIFDKPIVQRALASTTPAVVQQPPLGCKYPSKNEVLILSHVRKNRLRVLAVLHSRLFETPKSLLDSSVKCFTLRHHGIRKQETPRRFSLFQTPDLKAIILPGYLLTHFFRSLPF